MRLNFKNIFLASVSCLSLLFVIGCTQEESVQLQDDSQLEERSIFTNLSQNTQLIGLTPNNELVFLKSGPPVKETGMVVIQGTRTGEQIIAIDMQPGSNLGGSGNLFGVSNQSILYRINPTTGVATAITVDTAGFIPTIDGDLVAFDFNTVDGLIRLVTNTGQNLSLSPTTGAVVSEDNRIKPGGFSINSCAFAAKPGASTSTLYYMDLLNQSLYRTTDPATGDMIWLGFTGFEFAGEGGFDIIGTNLGLTVQYSKGRLNAEAPSNGFDNTLEWAHRLLYVSLSNGRSTSWGRTRPLIGLTIR